MAQPAQQAVIVVNTAANPIPVLADSANKSFQISGGDAASGSLAFNVPSGFRLAIEAITISEYLATSGVLIPIVTTTTSGTTASHTVPITVHPNDPSRAWGTLSVRIYADPSTTVTIQNSTSSQAPQLREFHASVSGFLIPAV